MMLDIHGLPKNANGIRTTHTCELCGFEPKTKNKYREKQDHLVMKHFKDRIDKIFPTSRPYKCPNPDCDFTGKDKQALLRHYTGKHGVLELYLREALAEKGIQYKVSENAKRKSMSQSERKAKEARLSPPVHLTNIHVASPVTNLNHLNLTAPAAATTTATQLITTGGGMSIPQGATTLYTTTGVSGGLSTQHQLLQQNTIIGGAGATALTYPAINMPTNLPQHQQHHHQQQQQPKYQQQQHQQPKYQQQQQQQPLDQQQQPNHHQTMVADTTTNHLGSSDLSEIIYRTTVTRLPTEPTLKLPSMSTVLTRPFTNHGKCDVDALLASFQPIDAQLVVNLPTNDLPLDSPLVSSTTPDFFLPDEPSKLVLNDNIMWGSGSLPAIGEQAQTVPVNYLDAGSDLGSLGDLDYEYLTTTAVEPNSLLTGGGANGERQLSFSML